MKKKVISCITVLSLSFGIVGVAGAASIPTAKQPTTNFEPSISILNVQRAHMEYRYYSKQEYQMSGSTPSSHFITTSDGYYGTIYRKSITEYGANKDWWKVQYSGTLTKFE